MNCVIIDDDKMSRLSLQKLCDKVDEINVVATFSSALEAVGEISNIKEKIDLFFLDVHMPDLDGFDFLKVSKNEAKIIFITSDPQRAVDAFEVEAVDYLIKPVTFPRFLNALQKVDLDKSSTVSTEKVEDVEDYDKEIFVKTDKRLVRIDVKDICIIEAKGDYIMIKMKDEVMHMVRSSLKSMEERLSPKQFIKVHRSYIVNISQIVDIEDSSILVQNQIVPISRNYKNEVIDKLNLL